MKKMNLKEICLVAGACTCSCTYTTGATRQLALSSPQNNPNRSINIGNKANAMTCTNDCMTQYGTGSFVYVNSQCV